MKNPWMKRGPWLAPLVLCVLLGSACGNTQTSAEPGEEQPGTELPAEVGDEHPLQASDCAAGHAAALQDLGDDLPEGTGKPVTTMSILNVGGTGSYQRVTNMLPGVGTAAAPRTSPSSTTWEEATSVASGPCVEATARATPPRMGRRRPWRPRASTARSPTGPS